MIDVAITAAFAFSSLSFNPSAIGEALVRTMADWKGRTFRVVATHHARAGVEGQPLALVQSHDMIYSRTPSGQYFSSRDGLDPEKIWCFCPDGSFEIRSADGGYRLQGASEGGDPDRHFRRFTMNALMSAYVMGDLPLEEIIKSRQFRTAFVPLGGNRFAIWGERLSNPWPSTLVSYCGIVRVSDDRSHAYLQQSDALLKGLDVIVSVRCTMKARCQWIANRPIFESGEILYAESPLRLDWSEPVPNPPHRVERITYVAEADFVMTEGRLLPEYYGMNRRTVFKEPAPVESAARPDDADNPRYFLALVVPLALLAVLYRMNRSSKS